MTKFGLENQYRGKTDTPIFLVHHIWELGNIHITKRFPERKPSPPADKLGPCFPPPGVIAIICRVLEPRKNLVNREIGHNRTDAYVLDWIHELKIQLRIQSLENCEI